MLGEPGLALGALGHSVKEEMDDVADEIPEEVSTPLGRLYMGGQICVDIRLERSGRQH